MTNKYFVSKGMSMVGWSIHNFSTKGLIACFLGVMSLISAPTVYAEDEKTFIIDLPPMRLDRALTQLARQTRISVDFSDLDLEKVRRKAVLGLFAREDALKAVLEGSGYGFRRAGPGAYRIIVAPVPIRRAGKPNVAQSSASEPPHIDDDLIIVHATKRASIARRLPLSLAVKGSIEMERLQINDTNALAQHTAGMSSTNLGPSRNKIFIRGISDGSFTGRQQATIGAYLDNIRLNYNEPDPYLQLEDVDHVEVLRGPQGTLYGAGSLGGLYRVVTNLPDMENYTAIFHTSISQTHNGGTNKHLSTTINLPLIADKLAFRATGYIDHTAGYIDDVALNLKNVNSTDVFGTRLRLLAYLNENWSVTTGLNFQDVIADDTQYFLEAYGPYNRANLVQEPHEDDYINPFVDVKGAYHWGDIVSSTAIVHRTIDDRIDASSSVPSLSGLPITASPFAVKRVINMITNESRLVSRTGGRFDWLIGTFASQRHETYRSSLTIPGLAASLGTNPIDGDVAFRENRRERTNEVALFGETTWHLPYNLNLTGGLRWFYSDERTQATVDGSLGKGTIPRAGKSRDHGFTPKAVLSYQPNNHTLYYVQASQGYRPGGINLNSPDSVFFETEENDAQKGEDQTFEPDKLKMYEVGGKFSLSEGRLQIDVAAFTFKWNDIQSDQILPDGFSFILNAGYARSRGLELEVQANPFEGFSLGANIAFNDAKLVIANPFLGANPNNQLPSIPKLAGGISAEYTWPAWPGKDWHVGLDYAYSGQANLTFTRADNRHAERSHMLNLRLELDAPEHWQVSLFVRNALNEKENTFAFGNPFSFRQTVQHTPPVPVTTGISVRLKY